MKELKITPIIGWQWYLVWKGQYFTYVLSIINVYVKGYLYIVYIKNRVH